MTSRKPLLLSFDVEEFDLPLKWGRALPRSRQLDTTEAGVERLLPVLARHAEPATFFVTGTLVRDRPQLVAALAAAGHEIGVHGFDHQDDYRSLPAAEAIQRLRAARALVQDASGQPVDGVRTPYLLPCPADRLRAAGFRYDASIHPTWVFGRYNNLRSSRRPWRQCGLLHLPISVVPFVRWPVSFLWYRTAGARLGRRLAHLAAVGAPYLHLYFHPWEAIDIPPLGAPRWVAVRTGAAFVVALDDLLVWSVPRYRCMTLGTFARGCAAPDLDQEGP